MSSVGISVLLEATPPEELMVFFSSHKTQISCMDEPLTFLNQLLDHKLVPEDLYEKAIKKKNKETKKHAVYEILKWLEKQGELHVKQFWKSVFQDHILEKYAVLRLLQTRLLDGSFRFHEIPTNAETPRGIENKETGGTKRKKGMDETEEGEEGPSSTFTSSQKRLAIQPIFLESTGSRSVLCPEDPLDRIEDGTCFVCNENGILARCTKCPRAFHRFCHLPVLQDTMGGDSWMCIFCKSNSEQRLQNQMRREDILNSPVSRNITHCRRLLLCLYKADELHVFTDNPTMRDAEWNSVFLEPMWLDKVKTKLQDDKYTTVGEFVRDVHLIFKNCQTLNKDNEFGVMGAKLKRLFEREFQAIFKIQ